MAHPLQQAAVRRKVIYFGVIIGLFTLSLFWRGKLPMPSAFARAASTSPVARTVVNAPIAAQAERLDLRELDQGDPEIAASAVRLALIGVRGPVITMIWKTAIDKQKRNEFHEFELLARLVTRLQPNFVYPWLFQGWNIAYNVSVENDKLVDTFYYISSGISLLAEGDRLNTKLYRAPDGEVRQIGSPDIRKEIGFFYQNKFGVSDKVQTLRCLMQLACIPPGERNPATFKQPDGRIDPAKFRKFCQEHPQLVRRLRTKLNCDRPEEVVQFLADNAGVPTRWTPAGDLAADAVQFPVLPPPFNDGPDEFHPRRRDTDDTFDAFHAARAWFLYSMTVIPPPKKDAAGNPIPWTAPGPGEYDQFKYRMPRSPAYIIFRQQGPRAQTYLAERLAKEGWFDAKSGWAPDARSSGNNYWFKTSDLDPDLVLTTPASAQAEWRRAFDLWQSHGTLNALELSATERANLQSLARKVPGDGGGLPPDFTKEQLDAYGITQENVDARKSLVYYDQNRQITNFPFFVAAAEAERDDRTIRARKLLWEADEARQNADNAAAIRDYVAGLAAWREVLIAFPKFHHPDRSDHTEEESYETELNLIQLLREDGSVRDLAKRVQAAQEAVGSGMVASKAADILQIVAEDEAASRVAARDPRVLARIRQTAYDAGKAHAAKVLAPAHHAAEALAGVAAGDAPKMLAALEEGIAQGYVARAQANADTARTVVDAEFPWLKTHTTPTKDVPWVNDSTKQTVRARIGVERKPTTPDAAASGGEPPATP